MGFGGGPLLAPPRWPPASPPTGEAAVYARRSCLSKPSPSPPSSSAPGPLLSPDSSTPPAYTRYVTHALLPLTVRRRSLLSVAIVRPCGAQVRVNRVAGRLGFILV